MATDRGDGRLLMTEMADSLQVECSLTTVSPHRAHTLTARKFQQFNVDFWPTGITCTPSGNVITCGFNTVRVYTKTGNKLMDLQTPFDSIAFDVDSTGTNIYVTDRKTESVLVFDHQGRLVSTNKINNVSRISGIAVSNQKVYISAADRNKVLEMDLCGAANRLSTHRQFAAEVLLNHPLFVCARGDVVAISSTDDHCVYCVDSRGRIRYTHGQPGQAGSSPNQLNCPWSVVYDRLHRLLIADFNNDRVCVVSDEGRLLGHIDLTEHELKRPRGITIDTEGHLLVACQTADHSRYCLVQFGYF
jgi:DNA-binding beta-propeller fold protein YncE